MKDFLLRMATGVAGTLILYRVEGVAGLAFAAPLWGLLMAKPIINAMSESARWIRHSAQNRIGWDLYGVGMYELRARQVDGYPWIVARDLLTALEIDTRVLEGFDALEYDRLPDSPEWGLSETGTRKLIDTVDTEQARKLALQIEREIFTPLRKRRKGSTPPAVRSG